MGKGGAGGTAKNYFGSIGGIMGAGPADWLRSLIIDGKTVWPTHKGWADDVAEIPVVRVSRLADHHSIVETATPHTLQKNDRFVLTGLAAPYDTFNCAAATTVVAKSDTKLNYLNATHVPVVASVSVPAGGVLTKVRIYYGAGDPDGNPQSLVRDQGGIWQCILTHDGTPDKRPPNPTYWVSYRVRRVDVANPFEFTVADEINQYGKAIWYWGTSDQTLRAGSFLLKNGHPPYRNQVLLELERWFCGTERQAVQNIQAMWGRAPAQTIIIGSAADVDEDNQVNPRVAEIGLFTDPIFGLGLPAGFYNAASQQAAADSLYAVRGQAGLSIVLDQIGSARSFVAQLMAYYDGWDRFNSAGEVESGRFVHNAAPPAFTDETTIDFNDVLEEIGWDTEGYGATFNRTIVKFRDRARAFTDAGQSSPSGWNREVVGVTQPAILDRPWITREAQALSQAAELGKINAQQRLSRTLLVRAEKAVAILPGSLFLLTHDVLGVSIVCRCTAKSYGVPGSGRVSLTFENERGIAPLPYRPTVAARGGTALPPAEEITLYQLVQPPPALSGEADFELMVLAARTSDLTKGLRPWLRVDDASLFYQLGEQRQFAVKGVLSHDFDVPVGKATAERGRAANVATLKVTAHGYATGLHVAVSGLGGASYETDDAVITVVDVDHFTYASVGANEGTTADVGGLVLPLDDDDSERLQVVMDDFTVQADLDRVSATQSDDAVNDNALLVWLISAGDPSVFEVCALKAIRLDGVYKLKVRRERFATVATGFVAGDAVFIGYRSDLVSYTHEKFGEYAEAGTPAVFRLQAFSPKDEADLTDGNVCPDVAFTFKDPFAPVVDWTTTQYTNTTLGGVPTNITDFLFTFLPTDVFKFGFKISSPSGSLVDARLVARLGTVEVVLWSQAFSPSVAQIRSVQFSIADDGCWLLYLVARDASGRVTERLLTVPSAAMGLAPGTFVPGQLCIQAADNRPGGATQQVLTPVASPAGEIKQWTRASVTLTGLTAGCTVYYKVLDYSAAQPVRNAPGNGWTAGGAGAASAGPFGVSWGTQHLFKMVYYYATKAGYADSPLGYDGYGYQA